MLCFWSYDSEEDQWSENDFAETRGYSNVRGEAIPCQASQGCKTQNLEGL